MLQGFSLFKRCRKLPAGHCVAGVQAVQAVSEPTGWALSCGGTVGLNGVRTNLLGTVLQGCRLFKQCRNKPAGHCVALVQTAKAVTELPAGSCVAGVQAV